MPDLYGNGVIVTKRKDQSWEDWHQITNVLTFNLELSEQAIARKRPGFRFTDWWFYCEQKNGDTIAHWHAHGDVVRLFDTVPQAWWDDWDSQEDAVYDAR